MKNEVSSLYLVTILRKQLMKRCKRYKRLKQDYISIVKENEILRKKLKLYKTKLIEKHENLKENEKQMKVLQSKLNKLKQENISKRINLSNKKKNKLTEYDIDIVDSNLLDLNLSTITEDISLSLEQEDKEEDTGLLFKSNDDLIDICNSLRNELNIS